MQLSVARLYLFRLLRTSEASGLQPTKYAVRLVFWNILIIFSTCWNVPGSTAYKIRRETRIFTISGFTAYFLLPVPKSH